MKAVSSDYKDVIKTMGREIDAKITYIAGSEMVELGGDELNSITPHYEGGILKSVMKQLDLDCNQDIPIGTILEAQFGVLIGNQYEYISFGNYIVYSSEKQEDLNSYKIVCYDKMLYSMKDYEELKQQTTDSSFLLSKKYFQKVNGNYSLYEDDRTGNPSTLGLYELANIYPTTIRGYLSAICTHLDLNFASISDNFTNYNRELGTELFLDANGESLNYTFRDVLDQIAQITASTICINNDDELEVRYINDTEETIDEEFLKDINVNFGESYGPINTITFKRGADADAISLSNPVDLANDLKNEIVIKENQFINDDNRADYLEPILDTLYGLTYNLNDFVSTGITFFDLCDRYDVSIEGTTYSCIMLNDEIQITQGLVENIHTDKPEDSTTDYNTTTKDDRSRNRTSLIVDKVNQRITSEISSVSDIRTIVLGDYALTEDTTFQPNKTYYILSDDDYIEYTNYDVGDTIPADTIYDLQGSITDKLNSTETELQKQINTNKANITTLEQQTNIKIEQSTTGIQASLTTITSDISSNKADADQKFDDIQHFLRYDKQYSLTTDTTYQANKVYYALDGGQYVIVVDYQVGDTIPANTIYEERGTITLGVSNSPILLKQRNDRIYFEQNGQEVAYLSNNVLYITDGSFIRQLRIGNFAFTPRDNGSLGFRKVA